MRAAAGFAADEMLEAGVSGGVVDDGCGGVEKCFLFLMVGGEVRVSGLCVFVLRGGKGEVPVACTPACLRHGIVVGCRRRPVLWRLRGRSHRVWPSGKFPCRSRPTCVVWRGTLCV